MIGLVDSVARKLVRRGLRRGLIDGSPVWLGVAAVVYVARLLTCPEQPKVLREDLRFGETLVISHVVPPERRRKRRRGSAPAIET